MKENLILKIIFFFCIMIVFLLFSTIFIINKNYYSDEKDYCLDTNMCKEGLEVNTKYGLIKINKENCTKYNWLWDDKTKYCQINFQ